MTDTIIQETTSTIHTPSYLDMPPRNAAAVSLADIGHSYLPLSANHLYGPFIEILRSMECPRWLGWEDAEEMREDDELSANLELIMSAANMRPIELREPTESRSEVIRLIQSVLGRVPGLQTLVPEEAERKQAKYINMFCKWALNRLETPIETVRQVLTDTGMTYGTGVAELTFEIADFYGREVITIKDIRPIPTKDIALITDNFRRVIAITSTRIPNFLPIGGFFPITPNSGLRLQNSTPRNMYLMFVWRPQAGDPRGRSAYLPTRNLFLLKRQLLKDVSEWSQRYAIPSIVGKTPENAVPETFTDQNGNVQVVMPAERMKNELLGFKNATVGVFPYGSEIDVITVASDGSIFIKLFDWINRQMTRAITRQHLATGEGESHSRAAAEVHQDALGLVVEEIRRVQTLTLQRDLINTLVTMNFGPDQLVLAPHIHMGSGDGFPISPMEVANLSRVGWFTESQMRELDERLGLPPRKEGERTMQQEAQNFAGMQAARGMRDALPD